MAHPGTLLTIVASTLLTVATARRPPQTVTIELSEWKIGVSATSLQPGVTTFKIHNSGTITHGFEVEGKGLEKRIRLLEPGEDATLTVTLKPGQYQLYCPVDH